MEESLPTPFTPDKAYSIRLQPSALPLRPIPSFISNSPLVDHGKEEGCESVKESPIGGDEETAHALGENETVP